MEGGEADISLGLRPELITLATFTPGKCGAHEKGSEFFYSKGKLREQLTRQIS